MEWVEIAGAVALAFVGGSKVQQIRAMRKAKREALKAAK
jgi:hypothetical protein